MQATRETVQCIRCERFMAPENMGGMSPNAPDRGPHEALSLPEIRQGSSLHVAGCGRSNPSPDLPETVPCSCR